MNKKKQNKKKNLFITKKNLPLIKKDVITDLENV